jgi:hypothetical protein
MKKLRLYIDTSVLGGLFDSEDPKRVDTAKRLLQLIRNGVYEGYISRTTIEEVLAAPDTIRDAFHGIISIWSISLCGG